MVPSDSTSAALGRRIREAMNAGATTIHGRERFAEEVGGILRARFGVELADIAALNVDGTDMVWVAAESAASPDGFASGLARRFGLESVAPGTAADVAEYVAGGNRARMAIAEFARASGGDWDFSDGFGVSEVDGDTVVMAAHHSDAAGGWQFTSYVVPCARTDFVALAPAAKRLTPSERVVHGDIGECADRKPAFAPGVAIGM